jgi:hypothetical protein
LDFSWGILFVSIFNDDLASHFDFTVRFVNCIHCEKSKAKLSKKDQGRKSFPGLFIVQ